MDTGESDAAQEAQDQREDKSLRESRECQSSGCAEQCAADIKPATIDAVCGTGEERDCDGVARK